MFDFIDLTEVTGGSQFCVKPMEIKALYATLIGTQVHYNGSVVVVKETIDEIKAMCKRVALSCT